jgi:hypothetical protein
VRRAVAAWRPALMLSALLLGGCTRTPLAHISQRRLDGPRPPQVMLRCRVSGLVPPIKYTWRFAPSLKQVGWNVPVDESVMLMTVPDAPMGQAPWAECTAVGAGNVEVRASRALVSPAVTAAPLVARGGELINVRGSGFGPARNRDDAVWLVPAWGRARALDHACKGAVWTDSQVMACVPTSLTGTWRLRVQAAGELAIAPMPVKVAP